MLRSFIWLYLLDMSGHFSGSVLASVIEMLMVNMRDTQLSTPLASKCSLSKRKTHIGYGYILDGPFNERKTRSLK